MIDQKDDKRIAVFGLFDDPGDLNRAIDLLRVAGFRATDISALAADPAMARAVATEKHTKAPEGAAVGAATGGVIGGALGLLVGIGALVIPGLGPLIAAGPIIATLAGAGAGGALGTLTGALVGVGIPEYEAKKYESNVQTGGSLLAVHADDREWADKAKHVLASANARGIDQRGEARSDHRLAKARASRAISPARTPVETAPDPMAPDHVAPDHVAPPPPTTIDDPQIEPSRSPKM